MADKTDYETQDPITYSGGQYDVAQIAPYVAAPLNVLNGPYDRVQQNSVVNYDRATSVSPGISNRVYNSYAGVDIVAEIVVPGEASITLGELQTISYSIHRENTPVRFLGHVNASGFVKGPRTIAGSLIFTVFNYYAFYRLKQYQRAISNNLYPLADMLPPFDIVLTFANESGSMSKLKIYGVTIVDEGGTMSVDDLITEQTYCVDDQTEALTKCGWKRYIDITQEDEFLTINPDTKVIEWASGSVNLFDYSGPMVQWSNSRGVDALTTPNHRWITTNQYQVEKYGFNDAKFGFNETNSIPVGKHIIVAGGIPSAFANIPTFSDALVALIGWTITEGTIIYNRFGEPYGVQISQSEVANPEKVQSITLLSKYFEDQGVSVSISKVNSNGCRIFYFGNGIGRMVGHLVTKEKTLTPEFLSLLTHSQALLLKEVLLDGDGHRAVLRGENAKVSTPYFIQNPGSRSDNYQMLLAMLGRRTSAKSKGDSGGMITTYDSNIIASFKTETIAYSGIVWCPTTRNGTWMARRNGNTFWTGNSYMARGIQPLTGYYVQGVNP